MRKPKMLRSIIYLIIGYMLGVLLRYSQHAVSNSYQSCLQTMNIYRVKYGQGSNGIRHNDDIPPPSSIYLGMMSAGKFIDNRVQRALDTWVQKGGWKVEVFADADASSLLIPPHVDFNIVTLPAVDDTAYPPQKKCFMMLRHMFDRHINNYEWFMRVDDDVYIDYQRLSRLLRTMNSSEPIFLGTPGFGMDADDGMEEGMFYLMGGPGMIFSRGLLVKLRSHLSYCVRHLFSPHEDIEIGRCVWKYVKKAKIPIAWETIEFFYQQYVGPDVVNVILEQLTEGRVAKTVAYHAVKSEPLLYGLHKLVLTRKIQALLNSTARLQNEIEAMESLLNIKDIKTLESQNDLSALQILQGSDSALLKKESLFYDESWPLTTSWLPRYPTFKRHSMEAVWKSIDKYYRQQDDTNVPHRGHTKREMSILWKYLDEIEQNHISTQCPFMPKERKFMNGYLHLDVTNGLWLAVTYQAYDSNGEKHCTVHVKVAFGVEMIDENGLSDVIFEKRYSPRVDNALNRVPANSAPANDRIVFIIPLQGRYRALESFMESYEENFLLPNAHGNAIEPLSTNILLVIVLMENEGKRNDELGLNKASARLLKQYQTAYGEHLIRYHIGNNGEHMFSRGAGIQLGTLVTGENDIVFFMDIDMVVTPQLAAQCRRNVVQHKTAWYPIPYSQYDPDRLCYNGGLARSANDAVMFDVANIGGDGVNHGAVREIISQTPTFLSEDRGFWRDFGFGITCMYNSDFLHAGGFNLNIEGWGEEDINMYLSLLQSGIDVFRAKQADLVHIFHPKYCDKALTGEQARACARTKASHFASKTCLAKTYFNRYVTERA